MWETLLFDFMQHALLAIMLGSITCCLLGSIVNVSRMTFLAGDMFHFAYGEVNWWDFSWLVDTFHHLGFYGRWSSHLGEVDSAKP